MSNYYCLFNDAIGIPDLRFHSISDSYTFVSSKPTLFQLPIVMLCTLLLHTLLAF